MIVAVVGRPELSGGCQRHVIVEHKTREALREVDELLATGENLAFSCDQPLDLVLAHLAVKVHDAASTNQGARTIVRELLIGEVRSSPRQVPPVLGDLLGNRLVVVD